MRIPLQFLVPEPYDLAYHQMWAAYEGATDVWRGVTVAHRDAMVEYAVRRSPYYRRTIPAGAAFEDIPVLTKALLRDHVDELHAEGVPEWRRHPAQTSGSTGEPVTLSRDIHQLLIESMSSDRFFRSLHGVPFDATIIAVTSTSRSGERFSRWARFRDRLVQRLGGPPAHDPWLLTVPTLSVRLAGTLQAELDLWGRLRKYFLIGQSSGLDWISQEIEAGRVRLPRPPVAIAATADMLTETAKERMERVLGAWVHTRYGSIEVPWLAASMPNTTDRYLCNPLLAEVEVLDDDGRPVGPGERGRVVVTDLNNRVMPLIRYDLGDLAVTSEEGHMGGFRILEGLVGRESELLRFPSGRILTASNLDKLLFNSPDELRPRVRAFQCAQTGPNRLELRLVWDGEPGDVAERLTRTLRTATDPDTSIEVLSVAELERYPSGKAWIVRAMPGARG